MSDGTTLTGYLDGTCVGTGPSLTSTWDMNGLELVAGARLGGNEDNWNGDLDELRVWRRALAPSEVAAAATWKPTSTTDLVSWYPFDVDAKDAHGSNDGTLFANAKVVSHLLRVTEVEDRAAWLATDLVLHGAGFTGTELVTVGGIPAPVDLAGSSLPWSLAVDLAPTVPDHWPVVVTRAGEADTGQAALLPTLAVKSTGLGGQAVVDLNATGTGVAVLGFSGATMAPLPIPPSWHGLELDPLAGLTLLPPVGLVASGDHQWVLPIPASPALGGLTLHCQAWAMEGFFSIATSSFSNPTAVTL